MPSTLLHMRGVNKSGNFAGVINGIPPKFVGDLAKIQKSFTHPESVEDEEPKIPPLLTK